MPFSDYPQSATNAAKRALKFKEENGSSCGTPVGWTRAQQLASREALSLSTVKRTFSFLSRAEVYDQGKFTDENGKEICGSIMYAAWGGKSMRSWCEKIIEQEAKRMSDENKEIRVSSLVELRYDEKQSKRTLSGYAVVFNDVTTIGNKFEERVDSTALDGVDMSNTFALYNHDWSAVIGRSGKNMRMEVDQKGLRVDVELPNTTMANDLSELVRSGIVSGMSFGFSVDKDTWTRTDTGMPVRTINQVGKLYEVTFTPVPAYPTTEVALRSMATVEDELKKLEGEKEAQNEAQTQPQSDDQADEQSEPTTAPQNAPDEKPVAFSKVEALKFLLDHMK